MSDDARPGTSLKESLQADLTAALKARDEVTLATLRMALAAVGVEEVAGKQARVLSDTEVLAVLTREVKKRKEAAEAFRSGGAQDRADREVAESAVLERYLPAQLGAEELAGIVAAAVDAVREEAGGALGPQSMGAVMKRVSPQVAGRADGAAVAAAVRAALAG